MMLVVGYGAMASAMVEGWLRAGFDPAGFTIYNPRPKPVPEGTVFTTQVPTRPYAHVLLGFKPGMLGDVAPQLAGAVGAGSVVLSVLAGIDRARLRHWFPQAGAVVRFMPNLAAAIGKSPNILIAEGLHAPDADEVTRLAEALGSAEWLDDESLFDLATALAGSGPAFVYRFIDALARGAAELGLPKAVADRLALRMVDGAAGLASASPLPPGELARRVASPGGMTQRGLDILDADDALAGLLHATLRATRDRAADLAKG